MEKKINQPSTLEVPQEPHTNPANSNKSSSKAKFILISLLILIILVIVGSGAYYLGSTKQTTPQNNKLTAVPSSKPSQASSSNTQTKTIPLFSGTLKPISDLGIFAESDTDKENAKYGNNPFSVEYYEAGIYTSGPHVGYTRIVAFVHTISYQQGYFIALFATKDNKSFIMNPITNYYDSGNLVKSKIDKTETLESEHPDNIKIDSHFLLQKIDFATKTDKDYKTSLLADTTGFKVLSSSKPNLKYFAHPNDLSNININSYIDGKTEVVVVDETGFAYFYNLTTQDNIAQYSLDKQKYDEGEKLQKEFTDLWQIKYAELEKQGKGYNNGFTYTTDDEARIVGRPYPPLPTYVQTPNLKINSIDIKNSTVTLYKSYSTAFPGGCATTDYTPIIKGITENEMTKIGKTNNFDVYVITDKNHPLYKSEFKAKIYDASTFKEVNKVDPPSYDKYASSYPLIFAKDPWGRWFALGEFDYQLMGGCGKPVIYFYPPKNTEVKINFQDPVALDLSIPSYNNGWDVLARPDGTLTDLQPQFTDCAQIDFGKVGSEYAKNACSKNLYPYIYWAGKNMTKNYPGIDNGWIVSRNELSNFMNTKLIEVGLTSKEKSDMLEYWLPNMMAKNAPFYRISFLTTLQMNEIAPMNITPKPDNLYRIFLDYLPLWEKPDTKITAPNLPKIERSGFTVVEWGGLLR